MGVGGKNLHIQPNLSKIQIMKWLHELRTFRYDEPTRLAARITELSPSLTQRALIIVFSDLHDADALPVLKRLGQRHDCVVLQFRDPAETTSAVQDLFASERPRRDVRSSRMVGPGGSIRQWRAKNSSARQSITC